MTGENKTTNTIKSLCFELDQLSSSSITETIVYPNTIGYEIIIYRIKTSFITQSFPFNRFNNFSALLRLSYPLMFIHS